MHPWRCPPVREITGKDYQYLPYPHEYPDEDIRAKLDALTHAIQENLGVRPKSYRAGRWGFDTRHIGILEELGYAVDSSVTPKMVWKDTPGLPNGEGGPDFSHSDVRPHFFGREKDVEAAIPLLEVPVTILYPFGLFNKWNVKSKFFTNNPNIWFRRVFSRLGLMPQWLRPYGFMKTKDMVRIYKRAKDIQLPCANMMFHSNELMPGGSPYHPDEHAVELLYRKMERFFEYLNEENVVGVTLFEFAKSFQERI
jgi:hypothetical protein